MFYINKTRLKNKSTIGPKSTLFKFNHNCVSVPDLFSVLEILYLKESVYSS